MNEQNFMNELQQLITKYKQPEHKMSESKIIEVQTTLINKLQEDVRKLTIENERLNAEINYLRKWSGRTHTTLKETQERLRKEYLFEVAYQGEILNISYVPHYNRGLVIPNTKVTTVEPHILNTEHTVTKHQVGEAIKKAIIQKQCSRHDVEQHLKNMLNIKGVFAIKRLTPEGRKAVIDEIDKWVEKKIS